jgi:hypothetical protein
VGAKVALSCVSGCVLRTPRQLGPTSLTPDARHSSSSSRWRSAPAPPISAKPAEMTTSARAPAATHSRATDITRGAGTTITARSTGAGRSLTDRYASIPWIEPPFSLTAYREPVKSAFTMLWSSSPPTVPRRRDAPTTTTDRGLRTLATAAIEAVRSRSRKRTVASGDSEVGNSTRTESRVRWTSTAKPLSRKTATIRWLAGSTSATKVLIPSAAARAARCASRMVAMPCPWRASETRKATSARSPSLT